MNELASNPEERLRRAMVALEGLSVGDALGDRYFMHPDLAASMIIERATPNPPWRYTDDTNMALSIVSILRRYGEIRQDELAQDFALRYRWDRGYAAGAAQLLRQVNEGMSWQEAAGSLFSGMGSYGNGGAMRVTPLGAYLADDMDAVVAQARLSAEVTHAHSEGIAGAIAAAVAAACACRLKGSPPPTRQQFLDMVLPHVPNSEVSERIRHARNLAEGATLMLAVSALGNGSGVSAQDTVPFTLWCAAGHLESYEDAFWLTVAGFGDRDTTCAIVGGIVASYTGADGIPVEWRGNREPLADWAFED